MFCANIDRIFVWFYQWCSVHTSHRQVRFHWWCFVRTSHCLWFHIWCSVHTTHRILILTSNRRYDSTDDNNLYNALKLWLQKRVYMYTRHKGYDSSDDPMCTHCTTAYDSEFILWTHITAWVWFVTILIIYMKKLLNSDWLRAVQLKCNTSAKSVTPVQITYRNSRSWLTERHKKIF